MSNLHKNIFKINFFQYFSKIGFLILSPKTSSFPEFIHKSVCLEQEKFTFKEFNKNSLLLSSPFTISNCIFKNYDSDYAIFTTFEIYIDSCIFEESKSTNPLINVQQSKVILTKTAFLTCSSSSQNSLVYSFFSPHNSISLCSFARSGGLLRTCFFSDQSFLFDFQTNNISYSESQITNPIGVVFLYKASLSYSLFTHSYTRGENCGICLFECSDFSCFKCIFNDHKSESESKSIIQILSSNDRKYNVIGCVFNDYAMQYVFDLEQAKQNKIGLFHCSFSSVQENIYDYNSQVDVQAKDCVYQYSTQIIDPSPIDKESIMYIIRAVNNQNKRMIKKGKQMQQNNKYIDKKQEKGTNSYFTKGELLYSLIYMLVFGITVGSFCSIILFSKSHFKQLFNSK